MSKQKQQAKAISEINSYSYMGSIISSSGVCTGVYVSFKFLSLKD